MDVSCGFPGRRRKVLAALRSVRRRDHAEERVYSSLIVAKKSSMRTVVSGSERGAWFALGFLDLASGDEVEVVGAGAGLDEAREMAEGRRGRGGTGGWSAVKGIEVVDAREGCRL